MKKYLYINYIKASNINHYGGTETISNSMNKYINQVINVASFNDLWMMLKKIDINNNQKILINYLPPIKYIFILIYCYCKNIKIHKLSYGLPTSINFKKKAQIYLDYCFSSTLKVITINLDEYNFLLKRKIRVSYKFPVSKYSNIKPKNKTSELFKIGYVGRWDKLKGTNEFVDIASNRIFSHLKFYVATYGINKFEIEKLNSFGIDVHDFSGDKRNDELFTEIFSNCDACIFDYQSLAGTTNPPLLPIEALSMGIACIIRPLGDLAHLFNDYPLTLRKNDENELMKVLKKYLDNHMLYDRKFHINFYKSMEERYLTQ